MNLDSQVWQIISNFIIAAGVIIAAVTIYYNVRIAKKTQTAHFLFESRKDTEYVDSLHVLKKAHKSGKSFRSYVIPCDNNTHITEEEMTERRKFQYILNFYERIAVSIQQGIYDEDMIKKVSYSTAVETYDISKPLIDAIRENLGTKTTYQEFEWLIKRWKKKPLDTNK